MGERTPPADVTSLRDEFESSTEWRLRRKFLENNIASLMPDRLVCLSRCFINVTLYGCSYPSDVMAEIRDRGVGILEEQDNSSSKQVFTKGSH
jgi:hypothetical protein